MTLSLRPITLKDASKYIEREHSHHHAPRGGLVAVAVTDGERVVCVAMLSRPVSRILQAGGYCAEINRVASDRTTPHAASKAIAALTRAAIALGYTRLVSYTLLGEAGTSYLAAGWWPAALSEGGDWVRNDGERAASVQPGGKVRWEFGPGCDSCEIDARRVMLAAVGQVALPDRRETLPLLARMV